MLRRLPYSIRFLIFWLVVFTSFRLLFLAFNPAITFNTPVGIVLQSVIAGLRLDLSTIAYLAAPVFVLYIIFLAANKSWVNTVYRYYHFFILFCICFLYVGSIKMYHEWNALLTYSVFDYLADPHEVISFVSYAELSALIVMLILYFVGCVWLFQKLIPKLIQPKGTALRKWSLSLLIPIALLVAARGGWQLAPINESSAYYTHIPFFNHVAVNPFWYFIHSYLELKSTKTSKLL